MYYQVLIETNEKIDRYGNYKEYYELDKTNLDEIINDIVLPFLKKEQFQFDGYFLNPNEIKRLVIKETQKTAKELSEIENENMPPDVIMYVSPKDILHYDKYTKDITKNVMESAKELLNTKKEHSDNNTTADQKSLNLSEVFVVHGRDEAAKHELSRFLEKLNLKPIILHEQASEGKTIIEKIEHYSNVQYGIVLYTPCDVGSLNKKPYDLKLRARQNVVFEHGYLIGKLGRNRVCALVKGKIELPTDISGIVYITMDDYQAWRLAIAKELRNAGYSIDMNLVV